MGRPTKEIAAILTALSGVFAWFAAPVLKYAAAGPLYVAGSALIAGLVMLWLQAETEPSSFKLLKLGPWLFGLGGFALLALVSYAGWTSDMNDTRCFNIQRHMLFPNPERSDLPEIFTALSCRPQGSDDIQFPSSHTIVGPAAAPRQGATPGKVVPQKR